jgi:hypothetical protein
MVTVTYYPFGQELKAEYPTLDEALDGIRAYHNLTSGVADYEISVRP